MQQTVHTRASYAEVQRALQLLPAVAAGRVPVGGLERQLLVRVGLTALGRIKAAFVTKARGGTDEAGERWQPLSPHTVAYHRRHPLRGKGGEQLRGKRTLPGQTTRAKYAPSYQLTERQRTRWWQVYRTALWRYKGDKAHAAAVAWVVVKSEGATTLMDVYGGAQVEILRDTGLLLASLTPGAPPAAAAATPPKVDRQVFRLEPGAVIIGTNRAFARVHHEGLPGRVPQRRLWPEPTRWPAAWWADIKQQVSAGLLDIALHLIRQGVRP